jgi:hypothetical protein
MHLSIEQSDRFLDLVDSLLLYVNDRFHVVRDLDPDQDDPLVDDKAALIAHTLWDNPDVIDEYLSSNPDGIDEADLATVASWKDGLHKTFSLVRYQNGVGLFMDDAHVFAVCGVTMDVEEALGRTPAIVETTLLPFDDVIVYDGFVDISDPDGFEAKRIQDAFEDRLSAGVVSTPEGLIEASRAEHALAASSELDSFLAQISGEEAQDDGALPEGFHASPLSSLSDEARFEAVEAYYTEHRQTAPFQIDAYIRANSFEGAPTDALGDVLDRFESETLVEMADVLGAKESQSSTRATARATIARLLPGDAGTYASYLLISPAEVFDTMRALAEEPVLECPAGPGDCLGRYPLIPYAAPFLHDGVLTIVVPRELRELVAGFDYESLSHMRAGERAALNCASAYVTYCGVCPLDEVYDRFCGIYSDAMSYEEFAELMESESETGQALFECWDFEELPYLAHYTLCKDFVASQVVQRHQDEIMNGLAAASNMQGALDATYDRVRDDLSRELGNLEDVRLSLATDHYRTPLRTLGEEALDDDPLRALRTLPAVRALRRYLDAHVPDGENDYTFADQVVDSVVRSVLEVGDKRVGASIARSAGLEGSDGGSGRLASLLDNVYRALPSWEDNGWSPNQLKERITGRTLFFDEDGAEMKIGPMDPCPCGSGKKYGECHGR